MIIKKFLSIFLAFIMSFGICSVAFASDEIPEGYTPIYTAEDLDNIRNNLSGKYILMNDIDLSDYENWEPIGTNEAPFSGVLDGNDFEISSLTISIENTLSGNRYYGLFGYAKNAGFNNTRIKNSQINITNISKEAARGYIGNIAGFGNNVTISNSAVSGSVNISGFQYSGVGGIIGIIYFSKINSCSNHSEVNVKINSKSTHVFVGGISGIATSVEQKCSNHGNISVNSNNVFNDCIVKVGGIDGDGSENMGLINSYNTGNISVNFSTEETYLGGLSGESYITENSYNLGKIIYPDYFTGYAGAVSGNVISDVLYFDKGPGMNNVYYVNDSLNPTYDAKENFDDLTEEYRNKVYINVKLLTEEELKSQVSFVGFDFEKIWTMGHDDYPALMNEPTLSKTEPEPPIDPTPTPSFIGSVLRIFIRLLYWIKSIFVFIANMFVG